MLVGIDLGTTHSSISVLTENEVKVIPNSLGDTLTPSIVSISEKNELLVGKIARERALTHPHLTASLFKRSMGSSKVFTLGHMNFSSAELSSLILKSLINDAEHLLNQKVTQAIITVPAYFNDKQRKDTILAAKLSGLEVKRLVNEPTAAAISYGLIDKQDSTHLIFDLGGGTFDVSIIEKFEDLLEIRSSAGHNQLGGSDFTDLILSKFNYDLSSQYGLEWAELSAVEKQILRAKAEKAKIWLSSHESFSDTVFAGDRQVQVLISQDEFENISKGLIQRIQQPLERALRDARLTPDDIDHIILAGGATRMHFIKKLVVRLFGKLPLCHLNPDEVVCMGAGYLSAILEKHQNFSDKVVTDVTPYSMGIAVQKKLSEKDGSTQDVFSPILSRNTVVPCSKEESFWPVSENQTAVNLQIYQGESRKPSENVLIGNLRVPIHKKPATNEEISVRFTYDANGLLEVIARSVSDGRVYKEVFKQSENNLTEENIQAIFEKLEKLKIHPRDQDENRYVLEKLHRMYEESIDLERDRIEAMISLFERYLTDQRFEEIPEVRQNILNELSSMKVFD